MLETVPKLIDMSSKQLRVFIEEANALLAEKVDQEIEAAKAKVKELAKEIGCDPVTLVERNGRTPARKKYGDGAANFWTGKGRTPAWLQEKLDQGARLENFLL